MQSSHSIAIIPTSHLDLFWLGDYRNCLRRGDQIIRSYLDRAIETKDETFVIDTAIFAEHFLRENPHYESHVHRLLAEGRLEIGGAYIDRWENLVLGESIIRNIQIGRSWARDRLGIETRLAAHPDLPGLNAQTAQIYSQAGIHYYVTSRKVFQEGRVWRHVAPDGSAMHMMTWPWHYVFLPLDETGLDPRHGNTWGADEARLSWENLENRYPHGVIAVSGSAGDLASAAEFTERYGKDLREYVGYYRSSPSLDVSYAIPATVMAPYVAETTPIAELSGSIPSVWGVAPDEEMRFFHRVRALEALLLDAETAAAIGYTAGRKALPESASEWRGLYAEDAFFAAEDTPPDGKEWEWLWRMHVFTQDHNGGGQDGVLSIFQKKVRHDRAKGYALEVLDHAVERGSTGLPTIVRSRLGQSASEIELNVESTRHLEPWLEAAPAGSVQLIETADGRTAVLTVDGGSGVGMGPVRPVALSPDVEVSEDDSVIRVAGARVTVTVSRDNADALIEDSEGMSRWLIPLGRAYAVPELGNDVTLATDESGRVDAVVESVELLDSGPIVARIRIRWRLFDVVWNTTLAVWLGSGRVDLATVVDWPGLERWQLRAPLVSAPRDAVAHGSPFHGSAWTDIPDGVNSKLIDEISAEDIAAYREVQHWLHVSGPGQTGLALLTAHPAFRHAGGALEMVLMRTAPSCGDPRMAWTNPGRTTWTVTLLLTDSGWQDVPELADIAWRAPRVIADGAQEETSLLVNEGDAVRLSALYLEGGSIIARFVNQSAEPRTLRLHGDAVGASAGLIDLDGIEVDRVAADGDVLTFRIPAWKIQTVDFGRPRRAGQ